MQVYEGRASELTDCVYHSGAPIFHDGLVSAMHWCIVCILVGQTVHCILALCKPAIGTGHAVTKELATLMNFCVKKVVLKASTDGLVQW